MSVSVPQPIHLAGTILPGGRHVCGFFESMEDEYRVTIPFVQEGLERNELAYHIVDPANRASYARRLEQGGIPVGKLEKSGQFELRTWPETYLRHGVFNPDAMLALLEQVLHDSKKRFPRVRMVACMNFPNGLQKTWDDWVGYEARLNGLLARHPDPIVCVYQTPRYHGGLVVDLLRTHPMVIISGLLQSNPFHVPEGQFLAALRHRAVSGSDSAAPPESRREKADAAQQQSNLEVRERMLAVVSHDLRNPLSAIMLGAAALKQEAGLSAEGVYMAARILASARRMKGIVGDVLELANVRLSGGIEVNPAPADAHELCARVVDELRVGYPGREIRLRVEGHGKGQWDADRLEQVVSNLASNALQYGSEETPLTIESRGSDTHWTLSVHNLGKPIQPKALQHLFDPFRPSRDANRSRSGRHHLGIGLFIVREVVQAHGGTVEATSTRLEGTRFVVRLPKG